MEYKKNKGPLGLTVEKIFDLKVLIYPLEEKAFSGAILESKL